MGVGRRWWAAVGGADFVCEGKKAPVRLSEKGGGSHKWRFAKRYKRKEKRARRKRYREG